MNKAWIVRGHHIKKVRKHWLLRTKKVTKKNFKCFDNSNDWWHILKIFLHYLRGIFKTFCKFFIVIFTKVFVENVFTLFNYHFAFIKYIYNVFNIFCRKYCKKSMTLKCCENINIFKFLCRDFKHYFLAHIIWKYNKEFSISHSQYSIRRYSEENHLLKCMTNWRNCFRVFK